MQPFTRNVKFTENGQKLDLGDGLWNTMSAKGSCRLFVTDSPAGQVTFLGTIKEDGTPAVVALRLKIENRRSAQGQPPDGRTVTAGPAQLWTWELAELFKIEKGKIRQIEAIMERAPCGMNSGWSAWEDGLSDRAR